VERGRWRLADLDLSASNRTLDSLGHRRAESCDSKDAHDPAGFHPSRPASVAFDRKAAVLIELRDEFDQLPELLCSASERSPFPLEVKAAPARRRHRRRRARAPTHLDSRSATPTPPFATSTCYAARPPRMARCRSLPVDSRRLPPLPRDRARRALEQEAAGAGAKGGVDVQRSSASLPASSAHNP
jgi:hypothetical protein